MKININYDSLKLYTENLIKELPIAPDAADINITDKTAVAKLVCDGESYSSSYTLPQELPLSESFIRSTACGRAILDAVSIYPPYGTSGGVRPFKGAVTMKKSGMSDREIYAVLTEIMKFAPDKAELVITVANKEILTAEHLKNFKKPFGLYISIPYCPSRCNYCSFISSAAPNQLKSLPRYLDLLKEELFEIKEKTDGMTLACIYIGGGTPTVLDGTLLDDLLCHTRKLFDADVEFTLEAGRPDTLTEEKLDIAEAYGVNRISINCQSLNDETLTLIGRRHTKDDYCMAMNAVKRKNFHTVNTDIIAGFENESFEDFQRTVNGVLEFEPENITVHSLCLKRASDITCGRNYNPQARDIGELIKFSNESCILHGYRPYYMYRQKYSAGNHENTGYAKKGHDCLYNIVMMSELCSIYGAGAGASTKTVGNGEKQGAAYNCKYPSEYILRRSKR